VGRVSQAGSVRQPQSRGSLLFPPDRHGLNATKHGTGHQIVSGVVGQLSGPCTSFPAQRKTRVNSASSLAPSRSCLESPIRSRLRHSVQSRLRPFARLALFLIHPIPPRLARPDILPSLRPPLKCLQSMLHPALARPPPSRPTKELPSPSLKVMLTLFCLVLL